jgi:hypothetical protein
MTSRERMLTAMRCEEPDRVPFLESVVEEPVARALLGRPKPEGATPAGPALPGGVRVGLRPPGGAGYSALEVVEVLGLDAIGMSLYLPDCGIYDQAEGVRRMLVGGALRSAADVARLQLPDPEDDRIYAPLRRFVAEHRATERALFCRLPLGADPVILGMGFERFALSVHDDRELLDALFDLYGAWYARAMRRVCALGFDFIWTGEDIAYKTGTYVSPAVFRELFMPRYRRVAAEITLPWLLHSDGNLTPVLDDLVELGLSGIHPVEPGAMDLAETKRRYGKRLCLCGHIDLETLSTGTPAQVERLVREAISVAGPGGGYIAGSSNSVTAWCKPENVRAMAEAIRKYGKYPNSARRGECAAPFPMDEGPA